MKTKKIYVTPQMEVTRVEMNGILCTSDMSGEAKPPTGGETEGPDVKSDPLGYINDYNETF